MKNLALFEDKVVKMATSIDPDLRMLFGPEVLIDPEVRPAPDA